MVWGIAAAVSYSRSSQWVEPECKFKKSQMEGMPFLVLDPYYILLTISPLIYTCNSSNLGPEEHGSDEEERPLTVRVQKKRGKPGQCWCLLLVIFAIIASKFCS